MKTVAIWTSSAAIIGFVFFFFSLGALLRNEGPDIVKIVTIFSIMGGIAAAALGAICGATKAILKEMRETRRELKHWQSIQQLDIELDKPSIPIKPAPPSGRV